MSDQVTVDQQVERMRMALNEAGFANPHVYNNGGEVTVTMAGDPRYDTVPAEVLWRGFWLLNPTGPLPCFVCVESGYGEECDTWVPTLDCGRPR